MGLTLRFIPKQRFITLLPCNVMRLTNVKARNKRFQLFPCILPVGQYMLLSVYADLYVCTQSTLRMYEKPCSISSFATLTDTQSSDFESLRAGLGGCYGREVFSAEERGGGERGENL